MVTPVTVPLGIDRGWPRRFRIAFRGIDLTGASLHAQIRLSASAPGDPIVNLPIVNDVATTGLRLASVTTASGVTTSIVDVQLAAMGTGNAAGQLPPANADCGTAPLAWDMFVGLAGRTPERWITGVVTVTDVVTREGALPALSDAPLPGQPGAIVAFDAAAVQISLAGLDGIAPLVAQATDALAQIQALIANGFGQVLGQIGYHPINHTRYMTVAVDGTIKLYAYPHYFVDYASAPGGTGTSSATTGANRAFSSLTEMKIALGAGLSGKTIGVRGGPTWRRDSFDITGTGYTQVNLIAYGGLVRLDGRNVVANNLFAAHAGVSGAYDVVNFPSLISRGGGFARMWQNGKPLKNRQTVAETSAAGAYWTNGEASTTGSQSVTIHPYGDTNPATDGALYEMTVRDVGIGLGDNSSAEGFHVRCFGSHDGGLRGGVGTTISRFLTEEGTVHNGVVGGDLTDVLAVNCMDDEYIVSYPIMLTHYVDGNATGLTAKLTRVAGIVDRSVYGNTINTGNLTSTFHYSHDGVGGIWGRLDFNQCSIIGLQGGITGNIIYATDLYVPRGYNVGSNANPVISANFRSIIGFYTEDIQRLTGPGNLGQDGPVENGLMIQESAGLSGGAIFHNIAAAAHLSVKNVILVASGVNENTMALFDDETPSAASTDSLTHCIVDGSRSPAAFAANAAVTSDYNLFRAQGGNQPNIQKPLYTQFAFADWQASGRDTHSFASIGGAGAADPKWASGNKPSLANPDPTLDPSGAGYAALTFHISKSYVDTLRARPATLAAAVAYLETVVVGTGVVL